MEALLPGDGWASPERVRGHQQTPGDNQGLRISPTDSTRDVAVVYLEAQDIPRVFEAYASSQKPFDVWYREQVKDIHGVDFSLPLPGPLPEVFIDPASGSVTPYTFPSPTPHGSSYDDLYFLNGKTYIAASNPSLDKNGMNTQPAVDEITLSGGKAVLKPILMGNATATDAIAKAKAPLTLTDPDSLSTNTNGNLVLIGQADN